MNKIKRIDFTQEIAAVIRAAKSENNLRPLLKRYHPRDVAKAASQLTGPERKRLLSLLDAQTLTKIFPYLDNAGRCLVELPEALAANVVAGMDAADALDILRELPAEKTQAIAAQLDDDTRNVVRRLRAFHEAEIGSRMSNNFVCIPDTLSIRGAMSELVRQAGEHDNISTIYVVDSGNAFYGAIDLKDLIIAREGDPLAELIATSYPYVYAHERIEDALPRIQDYSEDSIPVLDEENRMLGVVTAQSLIQTVDDALSEDYARLAGLSAEEDLSETLVQSVRKRLPWLLVLLGLGMVVSSVVGLFEGVVAQLTLIVCFQSLVLDMAGNVGTQSLAVTIRVLMDSETTGAQKRKLVWKEARVGLMNGAILGAASFVLIGAYLCLLRGEAPLMAFVSGCIGIALIAAMLLSSISGTVIPIFFKKIGVDPAVASGPLITTVNDLVAVVSYYGLTWLLLIEWLHLA